MFLLIYSFQFKFDNFLILLVHNISYEAKANYNRTVILTIPTNQLEINYFCKFMVIKRLRLIKYKVEY